MKAMILAAGRGERMRPLTDHTPKPLLTAAGKPIIEYTIMQLVAAGFTDIVINTAHLGEQLPATLGNGERWGANLAYSHEGEQALETAGGIINALPLLGEQPFLVVNGDIATDYDFAKLLNLPVALMHLVLISNPPHHPQGDFHLAENGQLSSDKGPKLTFSGIGIYHPDCFRHQPAGIRKLLPVIQQAIHDNKASGENFKGFWMDIGTPERLQELHLHYSQP
ncbi:MAG: N-acetylmuramate alpha-1-phosphate uridylyltransferase MurU [Methylococcales bacterium]